MSGPPDVPSGSPPPDDTRPSAAERARTAVASARVGCLTTYARHSAARPHPTTVAVECDGEGRPVLPVTPNSLAAAQLLARPLATLHVAPPGCEATTVHGAAHRLRAAGDGLLRYRLEVGSVRLGQRRPLPVPLEQYQAASPDPLRHAAPAVLHHLARCHAEQLAACLRTRGHDALWVEPRALDRRGLDVLSVGPDGVDLVRLSFPEPVTRLQELAAGLAVPLLCRCDQHTAGDATA